MQVPYADSNSPFTRKDAFDVGDYGMGNCTVGLELGCDCLGAIHYFDAVLNNSKGERRQRGPGRHGIHLKHDPFGSPCALLRGRGTGFRHGCWGTSRMGVGGSGGRSARMQCKEGKVAGVGQGV